MIIRDFSQEEDSGDSGDGGSRQILETQRKFIATELGGELYRRNKGK